MGVREKVDKLVKELHTVADELSRYLPAEDIENFRVFIEHDEIGIGVEILLDNIYEEDIIISKRSYLILEEAGRGHIDDSYFEGIQYNDE